MRTLLPAAAVISVTALAADVEVTLEIPRLSVAEYHRPYVAMWIERPDQSVAANLSVWYDQQTNKNESGATWLKDLRLWWRKSGRELKMPVDGVSGATRPPGTHQITFRTAKSALAGLPPGTYQFVVEAAREVGGRELIRLPFQWPALQAGSVKGQYEIGQVKVAPKP